jgi:hypothetical protein
MSCESAVAGPVVEAVRYAGSDGTIATGAVTSEITTPSPGVWVYSGNYQITKDSDGGPSHTQTNTCFDPPQGSGQVITKLATSETDAEFSITCSGLQMRLSAQLFNGYFPPVYQPPPWDGNSPCTASGIRYWLMDGDFFFLGSPRLRKTITSVILPSECFDRTVQFIDEEIYVSMSDAGVSVNTGGQVVDIPWGAEEYQDFGLVKQSYSGERQFFSNANATTLVDRSEVEQFFLPCPTKTWHIRT